VCHAGHVRGDGTDKMEYTDPQDCGLECEANITSMNKKQLKFSKTISDSNGEINIMRWNDINV
jgi:hypothetical protein